MLSSAKSNTRLYYLAGFLAFWFLVICLRLAWLQVVDYGDYTQRAARQQQRSIDVSPVRGSIYDRNGNELAMTVTVDSVFAVPSEVPDIHASSLALARALKSDAGEIEDRMHGSHAFAWVARKVDPAASARVRGLNLRGIYFQKESKRFYPKRELAAQVLGYVGLDDEGLGGMEREFDSKLTGKPGKMLISLDNKRRWFGRVEKNPESGENIVLTLDQTIQYIAERELEKAVAETHAEAGTVVVENPHTGEVLALANRPDFNPNTFSTANPKSFKNRAVSDIYEPGSTFKIVTLAAALEERLTNPDEVIDCQMGSIELNGRTIHDHKPYGALTVAQVLANSSDVGAIKLALRLGEDRFDRYIRAFGFGSQTGIELPGETRGITKPPNRWSKVSIGAISMGQEIGVSPLQLIAMASTIANDGVFVPPRIVAGTAQKTDPATGRYSKSHYIASFTGFAPVNNPAVSVLVVLDSPVGPHEGGLVAAPVFSRVMQQVLAYLNVNHDVELQDHRRLLLRARAKEDDLSEGSPDYLADETSSSDSSSKSPVAAVQETSRQVEVKPAVAAAPAHPALPAVQAPATQRVSISPTPAKATMVVDLDNNAIVPDFRGLSLRAALEEAQSAGIELEVSGSGTGREQSPLAGERIPAGRHVRVKFGR